MYRLTLKGELLKESYEARFADSWIHGSVSRLPILGLLWDIEDTGERPGGPKERDYFDDLLGHGYIEEVEE